MFMPIMLRIGERERAQFPSGNMKYNWKEGGILQLFNKYVNKQTNKKNLCWI